MQIVINVPDTLPKEIVQQRVKELEESLKKKRGKLKKYYKNEKQWCKEENLNPLI